MRLTGYLYPSIVTRTLLLLLSVFYPTSFVLATTFSSGMAEAKWQLKASVFECSLSHPLAAFGTAAFVRRAGEPETFRLDQKKHFLPAGDAELLAAPPGWLADEQPIVMGSVKVEASKEAVRLGAERARELQGELEQGRRLIFLARPPQASESPVRVILEPIRFRTGLKAYRECLAKLLPANFDQIQRTAVYFPETTETLPASELRKLDILIRYVKADKRISTIVIDGHTDSLGVRPENLEVSKTRAEMIANYLLEQGIAADKLVTRWHGERYPVVSNKTAQGRAQNRRVTLRVERGKS